MVGNVNQSKKKNQYGNFSRGRRSTLRSLGGRLEESLPMSEQEPIALPLAGTKLSRFCIDGELYLGFTRTEPELWSAELRIGGPVVVVVEGTTSRLSAQEPASSLAPLLMLVNRQVLSANVTKAGVFASIFAVIATWTFFFVKASIANNTLGGEYTVWGGVMPVAFCFAAGAAAMIIVSLATKPPSQETIDKFFPKKAA